MDKAGHRQRILLEEDTLKVATCAHETVFSLNLVLHNRCGTTVPLHFPKHV